jgi:hypothetical protein
MIAAMAESRRLEIEIFSESAMGKMVMTDAQCQEMRILIGRLQELKKQPKAIGIGTSIAELPSHTTGHTGHVSGDSAGQNRHR